MFFSERAPSLYGPQTELQQFVYTWWQIMWSTIRQLRNERKECKILTRFDRLLQELGGVWNLGDLTAPSRIEIPSYETPEGKDGIQVQIPIPDDYLPEKLMDFIKRNHGPAVLEKLRIEFNFHVRSRLAQLGIDGETEQFIWSGNQLMIQIRLYSMSSRPAVIEPDQGFMSLFRVDHASHRALPLLRHEGCTTDCGGLIQFLKARPAYDFGVMTKEELTSVAPELTSTNIPNVHLAYARLSPNWQQVADSPESITMPVGVHQSGFRAIINSQLTPFTDGTTHFVIGETVAHIRFGPDLGFNGPALLRPEIVGFHKRTGEVLVLRQTNSLCMGDTDWTIRVEVIRVDRQPISAQELAKYDFYMFLQFYGPTNTFESNL